MPRKPIAEKPMTSAERVRRYREKLRESTEPSLKKCLSENKRLKKRIEALKKEQSKLKEDIGFNRTIEDMCKILSDSESKTQLQFSISDIKLLIQVAHPDKHDQSHASIRATTLLNKVLGKY